MAFGLGKLKNAAMKKAAHRAERLGLSMATDLVPGGGAIKAGIELSGALKGDKAERIRQLGAELAAAAEPAKLAEVVELAEDAWRLGEIVKDARRDGEITPDEIEAICDAVEEVGKNALLAMDGLVKK